MVKLYGFCLRWHDGPYKTLTNQIWRLTYRCNPLGPLNVMQPWQVWKIVCRMRFRIIAQPTDRALKCLLCIICRHLASNVAWSRCRGGTTASASGTYAENVTFSMWSKDHVAGIGVRRPELVPRSRFQPHPLHGDHAIYDLLNKHFIWMSCLRGVMYGICCNESICCRWWVPVVLGHKSPRTFCPSANCPSSCRMSLHTRRTGQNARGSGGRKIQLNRSPSPQDSYQGGITLNWPITHHASKVTFWWH